MLLKLIINPATINTAKTVAKTVIDKYGIQAVNYAGYGLGLLRSYLMQKQLEKMVAEMTTKELNRQLTGKTIE